MTRAVLSVLASMAVGFVIGRFFLSQFLDLAWLPGGRTTFGAICGTMVALFQTGKEVRRLIRQRDFQRFADRSSLRFSREGNQATANRIERLTGRSGQCWLENEMQKSLDGAHMTVGDFFHRTSGKNSKTTVRTVAYFRGDDLYLPHFTLQPHNKFVDFLGSMVGVRDIDFSNHPEFSNSYHLSSDQPETTQQIFNEKCLKYLGQNFGWEIRAQRNQIAMTRNRVVAVAELDGFIQQAKDMLVLFRDSADQLLDLAERLEPASTPSPSPAKPVARAADQHLEAHTGRRPAPSATREATSQESFLARRIAANTLSWEDIEDFLRLPTPRKIPAAIQRQRAGCITWIYVGFLALVGIMNVPFFLLSIFHDDAPIALLFITGAILIAVIAAIAWILKNRKRNLEILQNGRLTSAEMVAVRRTSVEVNGQRRYAVEFRYRVEGEPRLKKLNVYGAHGELAYECLDSGEATPLLVDPRDADHCVLGLQLTNPFRVRL